jgi:tetratricopeptide (TPR) repeat protein
LYWRAHRAPPKQTEQSKLTEQGTIVIADVDNGTGDPVFDETLKQALSAQLSQSPFLNVLSARKVRAALKEMNRSANGPLTKDAAEEICRHADSKAVLTGSVGSLEKGYVLRLNAADCQTRGVLAEAQVLAPNKETVLKALDEAATTIRKQMGEPLSSVRKYATPVADTTMPSLEAWNLYSMGNKALNEKGSAAALPFFKRAVEIDPSFARAYIALCIAYANHAEVQRSEEYGRKAYELRDKVSERERFAIESNYYFRITGELDKAVQTYERWHQSYPKDVVPVGNSCVIYSMLGEMEKSLELSREVVRLEPNAGIVYENLADNYLTLNRLDEAAAAFKQAEDRKLTSDGILWIWYELAFVQGDAAQMAQLAAAAMGKPGMEDEMLSTQADTEAWYGRFKAARKLNQQAMNSAQRNDSKETAAVYEAQAALSEAVGGNRQQARNGAVAALKLNENRVVKARAALALAQSGDASAAEKLAGEIDKERPLATGEQTYWLPMIRAAVALERKDAVALLSY